MMGKTQTGNIDTYLRGNGSRQRLCSSSGIRKRSGSSSRHGSNSRSGSRQGSRQTSAKSKFGTLRTLGAQKTRQSEKFSDSLSSYLPVHSSKNSSIIGGFKVTAKPKRKKPVDMMSHGGQGFSSDEDQMAQPMKGNINIQTIDPVAGENGLQ